MFTIDNDRRDVDDNNNDSNNNTEFVGHTMINLTMTVPMIMIRKNNQR